MKIKALSLAVTMLGTIGFASAGYAADPKGLWLTEKQDAHVEIYDCGANLCGKLVWLKTPNDEDGKPKVDKHNPDEAARVKPLMGRLIIADMAPDGDNFWDDGTIYDAGDGKTYSSKMTMKDDSTLKVSGCILFFCKGQIWTRVD